MKNLYSFLGIMVVVAAFAFMPTKALANYNPTPSPTQSNGCSQVGGINQCINGVIGVGNVGNGGYQGGCRQVGGINQCINGVIGVGNFGGFYR